MRLDEPFPLEAVPPRLQVVILREFQGRCPSIGEVAQIPDSQWLSTPDVGPRSVEIIHDITDAAQQQVTSPSSAQLTDTELMGRLDWLQKEIRWLTDFVKREVIKQ
ncbi:hypothetical protein KBI52_12200 [Microvirga sp. HBU67558]|uniref:hypothetical protein n=1 Tax=Microvirga sp. HBU67558 TaxID=2824562 RepID=UPI001B37B7C0|nr:hypothetical protein [Microvirga sp. HBU67558]MBQ0820968.1 hypothetical protein [Microvirga sp. HBU67558]